MQDNAPTFIPKELDTVKAKGHVERIRKFLNLFLIIGVVVFVATIAGAIASYLLLNLANDKLAQAQLKLQSAKSSFDSEEIANLNRFDSRLEAASQLLEEHVIFSRILDEIEDYTLEVIQLKTASISFSDDGNITVNGNGEALNFESLAVQSDEIVKSKYIRNPIFSNFQRGDDNFVSFDYTFEMDPDITKPIYDALNVPAESAANSPTTI